MYLRMKLNRWSDLEAQVGLLRIPVTINKSLGYMEVYNDLESMLKDYPKEQFYVQIQEIK